MIAINKILFRPATPSPKLISTIPSFSSPVLGFNIRFSPKPRKKGGFTLLGVDESGRMDLIRKLSRGCLGHNSKKDKKVEAEYVSGGVDVFDDAATAAGSKMQPDHLVITVNGIIGSAADWRYAAEQFVKQLPDKLIVHRSECNSSRLTFDGVDLMGERLAEEVNDVVRRWHGVQKISFVAHSLGGLVARYAIGRLYECSRRTGSASDPGNLFREGAQTVRQHLDQFCEAKIAGLEPMNFITFATPHLGSRGHKQLPLLCGLSFLEKRASQTAHLVAGRSGRHLFLTDNDDGRPPLLLQMVSDDADLHFMSALRSFKRCVAYANANYDHVVGWRTSSIRRQDELPKENLLLNDMKYPHIVQIEKRNPEGIASTVPSTVGTRVTNLEEEMIRGLNQVSWERVDVSFHKSRQRYVAHNTIQASF